jgi:hypothetical protein
MSVDLLVFTSVFALPGLALALCQGRWWIPWLVPVALAGLYFVGWLNEKRNPGDEDNSELLMITGLGVVALSVGFVVSGLLIRRFLDRRRRDSEYGDGFG